MEKCVKCGCVEYEFKNYKKICKQCGNTIVSDKIANDKNELLLFIDDNSDYYLEKFNKLKEDKSGIDVNWCAMLLAPYWFMYRKLYE